MQILSYNVLLQLHLLSFLVASLQSWSEAFRDCVLGCEAADWAWDLEGCVISRGDAKILAAVQPSLGAITVYTAGCYP